MELNFPNYTNEKAKKPISLSIILILVSISLSIIFFGLDEYIYPSLYGNYFAGLSVTFLGLAATIFCVQRLLAADDRKKAEELERLSIVRAHLVLAPIIDNWVAAFYTVVTPRGNFTSDPSIPISL